MVSITIDRKKCVGCEDCVFICPVSVYKIEKKKAVVADRGSCCGETCRMCVDYCWKDAIRLGLGTPT